MIHLLLATLAFASPSLDELRQHASEVPRAAVTREASEYITNETNESLEGMTSHYTLALYERGADHWYILDGYYILASGRILFLDFIYFPETKTWQAINNYQGFNPGLSLRYMLKAEEICNPYKRHFIGALRLDTKNLNLDRLRDFFAKEFSRQPILVVNDDTLTILDPTKSARMSQDVLFTLNEGALIEKLVAELGVYARLIPSGRRPSTPEFKQTYVGVTESCKR